VVFHSELSNPFPKAFAPKTKVKPRIGTQLVNATLQWEISL